ncbi:hypothetical protein, partial [Streptomyces olindensis]|uniref:hypothetical protein n=1 Tax=Streptomyces olindensis TaxID=358823 RepID=UPI0033E598DA
AEREDVFYLTFQEFHEVVRSQRVDHRLIRQRDTESRHHVMAARPPIRSEVAREGVREGGHT